LQFEDRQFSGRFDDPPALNMAFASAITKMTTQKLAMSHLTECKIDRFVTIVPDSKGGLPRTEEIAHSSGAAVPAFDDYRLLPIGSIEGIKRGALKKTAGPLAAFGWPSSFTGPL
jgi:hypothetical protein